VACHGTYCGVAVGGKSLPQKTIYPVCRDNFTHFRPNFDPGNLVLSGLPYLMATWLGYSQPDVAGLVHDYGTKFLVGAGLLNLLAMVDAFEIAAGRKD